MSETSRAEDHDLHTRRCEFFIGQRVLVRNLRNGPRWLQGTVIERKESLSYLVHTKVNDLNPMGLTLTYPTAIFHVNTSSFSN